MSDYDKQTIIKKSPIIIIKNFIALQVAAVGLFFLAGVLADFGELYANLPFSERISFRIVEMAGIFGFETVLIFYIFFRWFKEYYEVEEEKIIYGRGIIFRKKTVVPLKSVHSIDYRQSPLGRLTKYGSIELKNGDLKNILILNDIPEPQKYSELIAKLKNQTKTENISDQETVSLDKLIADGEGERLEFKSSLRWDDHQGRVNKNLEKATMKTIAAFMNSRGGRIIIGVNDSGDTIGLENDYRSLPKSNSDGFHNHFTNIFHSMLGAELRQFVSLSFYNISDKEICLINVRPSNKPAYLRIEENEEFYIRTGNGTTSLKLSEATSYVDSHWKGRLL